MIMNVTIDIKVLAIVVIVIAVVVLAAYLVKMLKRLIVTLEHANKILEDVEVISEIAANRSKDVDGIIGNVSESVSDLSTAIKGNQNIMSAIVSVVKAAAAVKNAVTKDEEKNLNHTTVNEAQEAMKGVLNESDRYCKKSR